MHFFESESRRRHHYIDSVVAETLDNLKYNENVADRMDSDMRHTVTEGLGDVFIPNVRNNVISIPKAYKDTDSTPIVAANRDEKLILGEGFGSLTPYQEQQIIAQTTPLQFADHISEIKAALLGGEGQQDINRDMSVMGLRAYVGAFAMSASFLIHRSETAVPQRIDRWLIGRSVVALLADRDGVFSRGPSLTGGLVHEFIHVIQQNNEPLMPVITDTDLSLRIRASRELEAYHHAAWYERGLFESSDPRYSGNNDVYVNALIESRRLKENDLVKPYDADGEFLEWLVEMGAVPSQI